MYPLEVSRCIKALAGVADAVVAGVPDKRWGESLAAFVVRAEGRASRRPISWRTARASWAATRSRTPCASWTISGAAHRARSREQLEELKGLL
ncbi:MAG: hypothetical protein V8S24_14105 [Gordonibacter pamelaeae]